jgi:hypothetical protein
LGSREQSLHNGPSLHRTIYKYHLLVTVYSRAAPAAVAQVLLACQPRPPTFRPSHQTPLGTQAEERGVLPSRPTRYCLYDDPQIGLCDEYILTNYTYHCQLQITGYTNYRLLGHMTAWTYDYLDTGRNRAVMRC